MAAATAAASVLMLMVSGCLMAGALAALNCPDPEAQARYGKCDMKLIHGTPGKFNGGIFQLDCSGGEGGKKGEAGPKLVAKVVPKRNAPLEDLEKTYGVKVDVFERLTAIAGRLKAGKIDGVLEILAVCHYNEDAEAVIMPQAEQVPADGWTVDCFQDLYDTAKALEKHKLMNNDIKYDNVMMVGGKCKMIDQDSICEPPDTSSPSAFEMRGIPPTIRVVKYSLITATKLPCIISSYQHPNRAHNAGEFRHLLRLVNEKFSGACQDATDMQQCLKQLREAHKSPDRGAPGAPDAPSDDTIYKALPGRPEPADESSRSDEPTKYKAMKAPGTDGQKPSGSQGQKPSGSQKQSSLSPSDDQGTNYKPMPAPPSQKGQKWVRGQINKNQK